MHFPDIIPLGSRNLPEFPVDALPGIYGDFARELAKSYQVPVDLPASLMLPVAASAMAKRFVISGGGDWVEPCNLYVAVSQPPGSRKSAIFKEVTRPINAAEAVLLKKFREELGEDNKVPAPRLVADDVSPERLATLMAQNDGRIAVFSAEGGIFDTMAGRYSNNVPNLDVYLKGHAGDTLRVDRVTRDTEIIHDPALTMGITFQPEILRGLALKPGFRGRGLLGRILYSNPLSLLGRRLIDPPAVNPKTRQMYVQAVESLMGGEKLLPGECTVICLSSEAAELFAEYRQAVELALGPGGELENIPDWGGKLPGHILRVAGLLWGMDSGNSSNEAVISSEIVYAAIRIGEYFKGHALAAFELMGADQRAEVAARILKWIEREEMEAFSERDAHQALKGGTPRKEEIENGLNLLMEHGYITRDASVARFGPGRKPSRRYLVNPKTYSQNSRNVAAAWF